MLSEDESEVRTRERGKSTRGIWSTSIEILHLASVVGGPNLEGSEQLV